MKKRGISPLIATVLLIGMTIMVSVIVFTFVRTTIEDKTSETEMQSNILLACSQTLDLEYNDPIICGADQNLIVTVWNRSPIDVVDLKIQVVSNQDSMLFESGVLNSYNKELYDIDLSFGVGDISSIILIPTLELGDSEGTCPGEVININDILPCN